MKRLLEEDKDRLLFEENHMVRSVSSSNVLDSKYSIVNGPKLTLNKESILVFRPTSPM